MAKRRTYKRDRRGRFASTGGSRARRVGRKINRRRPRYVRGSLGKTLRVGRVGPGGEYAGVHVGAKLRTRRHNGSAPGSALARFPVGLTGRSVTAQNSGANGSSDHGQVIAENSTVAGVSGTRRSEPLVLVVSYVRPSPVSMTVRSTRNHRPLPTSPDTASRRGLAPCARYCEPSRKP